VLQVRVFQQKHKGQEVSALLQTGDAARQCLLVLLLLEFQMHFVLHQLEQGLIQVLRRQRQSLQALPQIVRMSF
jgi:hypothetical protein